MSSRVREREHDPEPLPPAGAMIKSAWSYISKPFVFMVWHLINLRDMITFTSRYCNEFMGSISQWKFITLKVQYTTVDYN
jgi:hypothetical protein